MQKSANISDINESITHINKNHGAKQPTTFKLIDIMTI
jgi:hypothetical protein